MVTLLPLSSVQIKNEWSYTSTPLIYLNGMNMYNLFTFKVQPRHWIPRHGYTIRFLLFMSLSLDQLQYTGVLRQYTVSPCNTSFT